MISELAKLFMCTSVAEIITTTEIGLNSGIHNLVAMEGVYVFEHLNSRSASNTTRL